MADLNQFLVILLIGNLIIFRVWVELKMEKLEWNVVDPRCTASEISQMLEEILFQRDDGDLTLLTPVIPAGVRWISMRRDFAFVREISPSMHWPPILNGNAPYLQRNSEMRYT